ncbi:MAG: RNA polymerase sigma factor [Actinomycetales bacterium]
MDDASLDLRDLERETEVARLFDAHARELTRLAVLLGAGDDAEDIVAEAFCELHRRWARLRDRSAAVSYLRSTVCNLARMRLRHLQVVRRRETTDAARDIESAEYTVLMREEQRQLVAALARLPERQREALVLRYWLDLREVEIAEAMGISAGAVKSHIFRAMGALGRLLDSQEVAR